MTMITNGKLHVEITSEWIVMLRPTLHTEHARVESACGKKWLGKRFDSLARAAGSFMVGEWDDVEVALVPNSLQTTLSTRAPNHTQRHLAQTQTPAETDTEIHADRDGDRDGDARTNDWESVPDGARGLDGTDGWTAGGRIQPHPHTHPHTHTPNTGSCDIETCRHELTVKQWSECLEKGGGLVLTEREQYSLAAFGSSYSSLFNQKWLNGLISEDDMVDSFTAFHPDARERFTCFEQYTNRRYFNEGARIDFIMVDRPLFQQCASIGHALQGRPGPEVEDKVQGRISPEVNVQVYPQIKSSEETIQKTCNGESNLATAAQRSIQDQPTRSTTDNPNQESTEHSHTTDTTNTGPGQELAVTRLEAQSIAVGTPGPIAPTVPSFKVPGQADAMHCVTAGGLFVPAPFDGSGMMEAPRKAYEFHIIAPHTGMIYTPPKFSDHLPVCLLLQDRDGARCCSRTCACACACAKTDVSSQPLRDAQAREKESAAHATTETLCTRARPCTSPCMCPRACACACARAYVCRRSSTTTTQWSQWKLPRNITLDKNHAGTRRTQPFAAQKKLTAFFSATTAATATATAAGAGNDPPAAETGQSSPAVPAPVDLAEGPTGAVQEDRDGDVNNTHVREQSRTVGELGATTSVNTFGTVVVGDAGGTSVGISSSGDTGKAMPHRDATVTVGSTATHSTGNVGVEVVGADSAGTDKVGRRKPAISSRDEAAIFAARMMDKSLLASERRGQVKRRQAQQKQGTITKRDKSTKQMVGMGIGRNGGSIGNGSDAINRTGGDGIGLGAINRTRGGGGDGVRAVEPAQRKAKAQRRKQAGKKSGGVQASILGFFGS
ncbi:hypothetical protein SARC_06095 [Sphaeroforma arctica JP610]|uniref:Uncharacterized protein n=1 Tax=Sphaeroforma arctica JP610 TaxID=667725 RepID=A0A0L0FY99_9EUKA|nr:hypothetical protein SARC_06095 [Sphaeroforma arctica JP610]KNC81594.1 hypothetical protein SARC_06095 [Sphaeroforma arctica JP610]|eukprot:XP_014155496.1 hypothetical protein SARC_06095 [Sphaeroforma arctica JP610]